MLISVACVLVTPKRKLAGHLAVRKNELHFFGEFLVEGTGGSSVFRNFCTTSDSDLTKTDQKQRPLKWRVYLDLYPEKDAVVDDSDTSHENVLKRKQLKSIKRHRRWNIGKVVTMLFYFFFVSFPLASRIGSDVFVFIVCFIF